MSVEKPIQAITLEMTNSKLEQENEKIEAAKQKFNGKLIKLSILTKA